MPTGLTKASDGYLFIMLKKLVGISGTVFLVIDALDEFPKEERKGKLFPFLIKLRALGLQSLRLILTSRPQPDIEIFMREFYTHRLNIHGAQSHKDDLIRYISSRLYSPDCYQQWPASIKEKTQRKLSEKSNGM
jgi:hypothetical protein